MAAIAAAGSRMITAAVDGLVARDCSYSCVVRRSLNVCETGSVVVGGLATVKKRQGRWHAWKLDGRMGAMLVANAVDSRLEPVMAPVNGTPSTDVLNIWRTAEAVCFDVDSTVCIDEGIDELASYCGAGEAVAAWTTRAMGGSVSFQEALAARLGLFRPSLSVVENFLASNPPRLTPGIRELVEKLHSRGTNVYLVSGGFRQMIEPAATILNIPKENIFANRLLFGESGEFAGFDDKEPTSRSGGKAVAISQLKKKHGYKRLVMIGDGATDLEARMPGGADIFICYGGVQFRPNVAAGSDWCVLRFDDLIQALSS